MDSHKGHVVGPRPLATFPAAHPAFAGHFAGDPIVPGALLLDELIHRLAEEVGLPYARFRVQSVKFLASVRPDDAVSWTFTSPSRETFSFVLSVADSAVAAGVVAARPA